MGGHSTAWWICLITKADRPYYNVAGFTRVIYHSNPFVKSIQRNSKGTSLVTLSSFINFIMSFLMANQAHRPLKKWGLIKGLWKPIGFPKGWLLNPSSSSHKELPWRFLTAAWPLLPCYPSSKPRHKWNCTDQLRAVTKNHLFLQGDSITGWWFERFF